MRIPRETRTVRKMRRAWSRLSAFRPRHLRAPGAEGSLDEELPVRAPNPLLIKDVGAGGVESELGRANAPFDEV
jgi:hypothetical protein